jgi:cytochrome c oxidase assembly protein subunit 15
MQAEQTRDKKWINAWLLLGAFMVFVQILLGGITRLTGSGLSITHWDIITGIIPPLNQAQWDQSFLLYKQTPQYRHINEGMSLAQFKFIFFWEYIHRLWARSMGFVFLIPFLFFLFRKSLSAAVLKKLAFVVFLASLAAIFGWIMVASGLVNRPWVNAYKLTINLLLGILLFLTLFFTWLSQVNYGHIEIQKKPRNILVLLILMTLIQVVFGGFVSGMKSALFFPTWPDMNGEWIPGIILDRSHWNADNFLLYDQSGFMPALAQFIHRSLAYLIAIVTLVLAWQWHVQSPMRSRFISFILLGIIVVQLSLGVLILLNSHGSIPVFYGSLHQSGGILFLTFLLYLRIVTKPIYIK